MTHSETLGSIAAALSAFRDEMPDIDRNRTVQVKMKSGGQYSFDYATLDHIMDLAVPVLAKHKLAFSQMLEPDGITTIIMHESGEYMQSTFPLKYDGNSMQDLGSEITYARRYALTAALGIAAEQDDDGNRAAGNEFTSEARSNGSSNGSISEAQGKRLYAIAMGAGYSRDGLEKMLQDKSQGRYKTTSDVQRRHYDMLCAIAENEEQAQKYR